LNAVFVPPPVCWRVIEKRVQVRRPDDIDTTSEPIRGEGQSDKRGVAAVGHAHDRDLVGSRDAGGDGPVHGIDQIIMHLGAPFQIAGGDERLAEAGRATKVHRQDGIATVGQPLMKPVVAVYIP
jgi:hypothetical protein